MLFPNNILAVVTCKSSEPRSENTIKHTPFDECSWVNNYILPKLCQKPTQTQEEDTNGLQANVFLIHRAIKRVIIVVDCHTMISLAKSLLDRRKPTYASTSRISSLLFNYNGPAVIRREAG